MEEYEVVVRFQALQAFGVSVDAVCPGKKSGDICPTAIHQHSTSQFLTSFPTPKSQLLLLVMAAADSIRGRKCTGFPPVRPVLVATGAHWVEPEVMSSVVDGDIVSGVTYEGNPKFIRLFVKVLGGNITGSDRRILFLCGDFGETSCIPMPWAADLSCSWCFCSNCLGEIYYELRDEDKTERSCSIRI
ncbi:hypothetical protein ACFX13_048109 [Malus domestica]